MKILVVSDTHNNISLFKRVLSACKPDMLFHLGDYYEDNEKVAFAKYCKTLYRVPGIYHPGYRDASLKHIEELELLGITLKLVHNIDDIDFSSVSNSLVFYGHSHIQSLKAYKSNILINPGHLKSDEDRQQLASYIVLNVKDSRIVLGMYQVEKGLINTYIIKKNNDNILELVYGW